MVGAGYDGGAQMGQERVRVARESIFGSNAGPPVVWVLALIFILFELLFQLADAGLLPQDLRWIVYLHFAFFDLFWEAMLAGYETPPFFWATFLSHALLHGGLLHLFI